MSEPTRTAAIEGWFSLDAEAPHLIGSKCPACGTYFFPPLLASCRNPSCTCEQLERAELSRVGHVWSYTNACYPPPAPYVAAVPFEPFAIAAVQLEKERMIVLGQVIRGVGVEQLRVGMRMELVLERLFANEDSEKLIWKWKPAPVDGA